jgi:uncharacterized phage protein (TIGR01671 family)
MNQREIKFRAWDTQYNEMIYLKNTGLQYFDFEGSYALSFVVDGYKEFWAHEQYSEATKKAKDFPIMQFTGRKDRTGKEIYEGDELKHHVHNMVTIMTWIDDYSCFAGVCKETGQHYYYQKVDDKHLEITGNIFENLSKE